MWSHVILPPVRSKSRSRLGTLDDLDFRIGQAVQLVNKPVDLPVDGVDLTLENGLVLRRLGDGEFSSFPSFHIFVAADLDQSYRGKLPSLLNFCGRKSEPMVSAECQSRCRILVNQTKELEWLFATTN